MKGHNVAAEVEGLEKHNCDSGAGCLGGMRLTRVLRGLEHVKCLSLKHSAYRYRTSARHKG